MRPFVLLPFLVACAVPDAIVKETGGADSGIQGDEDGDGITQRGGDCDDNDAQTNPGAAETCDGVDNNCDGNVDEGLLADWFVDADGDGFGDLATLVSACEPDLGLVSNGDDCDDAASTTFPGASELCDGLDNDCDGLTDDDGGALWYVDADSDGYGSPETSIYACSAPARYASTADDCDDADPAFHPGAAETCDDPNDYNCDGSVGYADADGDGFAACLECDDTRSDVSPAATEVCNGVDDDCDGAADDADVDVDLSSASTWYADADGDSYGDASVATIACVMPAGMLADSSDCDDSDVAISPAATEVCNGVEDDCDALTDDADPSLDTTSAVTWYADADGDGYGDATSAGLACEAPAGTVADASDCDDTSVDVSPSGTEVCNGIDDDCDSDVDDADASLDLATGTTWYADADGDGYGDVASAATACIAAAGFIVDNQDCDDARSDVSPAATEVCNGIDDDCNGVTDDADPGLDTSTAATWYSDLDGDGYGDPGTVGPRCEPGATDVSIDGDCDDTDALVSPAAIEVCDLVDNDCDGWVDDDDASLDSSSASAWYTDADSDGYGDPALSSVSCLAGAGEVANDADCDDTRADVSPAATELCNGVDDDCDSAVDDGLATTTWYEDNDGDGFGDVAVVDCTQPSGTVTNDFDCDDTDATIYPGGSALCAWESCLELLTDGIASTDGSYWIDFDGVATETECDMTTDGGGWTLIFSDDFESAPDPGWSTSLTYACGPWSTMLGGYNNLAGGSASITASTYAISHTESWVELNYIKLDSWDGETASISMDGATLWSKSLYYYEGSEVCGWNRGWSGSYDDRHALSVASAHTGASILFAATSTLDQGPSDESFGIDDVYLWIR